MGEERRALHQWFLTNSWPLSIAVTHHLLIYTYSLGKSFLFFRKTFSITFHPHFLIFYHWPHDEEDLKTQRLIWRPLIVDIDKNSWSGHPYSCHIIIKRKIHLAICLLYHKNKFLFRCWSPKILWSPVIARVKMSLGNELSVC